MVLRLMKLEACKYRASGRKFCAAAIAFGSQLPEKKVSSETKNPSRYGVVSMSSTVSVSNRLMKLTCTLMRMSLGRGMFCCTRRSTRNQVGVRPRLPRPSLKKGSPCWNICSESGRPL